MGLHLIRRFSSASCGLINGGCVNIIANAMYHNSVLLQLRMIVNCNCGENTDLVNQI